MGKSLRGFNDPTRANAPRIDDMFAVVLTITSEPEIQLARRVAACEMRWEDVTRLESCSRFELRIVEVVGGCTTVVVLGVNVVDKGVIN